MSAESGARTAKTRKAPTVRQPTSSTADTIFRRHRCLSRAQAARAAPASPWRWCELRNKPTHRTASPSAAVPEPDPSRSPLPNFSTETPPPPPDILDATSTTMEGAFTHMGNHLVSDSAATINAGAGDDESILDGDLSRGIASTRRRRMDDEETDVYDDDDMESMMSMPVGANGKPAAKAEEDVELPPHACA